ncbi:type III secretion system stalk subunit SctO [Bradyrhizobium liaoningense]|uniref:type III secretion system stalk subunit SctO n=1 Tax=Bradyrhizobium liaoningense TaxID=43992 RepID=UPI001BA97F9E|nr:YscO family type III secretion system apparatus protein [Bradyrhizobium liaoningense]
MIEQLKLLLRLKELKQDRALRAVNTKRIEASAALTELGRAQSHVSDSERTLPEREDAIYEPIIGRVIGHDEIEETKGRLWQLESQHARLVDASERAVHVHARLERQLKDAVAAHRQSMKERDKYSMLTDTVRDQVRSEATYRDEIEIEDMFSSRRRRP